MSARRKKAQPEEHVNHERWAISYLDMVTVMMCLFIVLFAISSVDETKYEQLANSLATSFGTFGATGENFAFTGGAGILNGTGHNPDGQTGPDAGDPFTMLQAMESEGTDVRLARAEVDELSSLQHQIEATLAGTEAENDVTFRIDERGLVIGLVSTDVFFEAESSRLTDRAYGAIGTIAPVLGQAPNQIAVEGHANIIPPTRYASNWELSSERATTVLRSLIQYGDVDPSRLRAVGMGDAHPVQDSGVDPMIANRRVDVIVMSAASEHVRSLIPQVVGEQAAA